MKLICIAHRGEATSFLDQLAIKSLDKNFYLGEDICLLLTKEGPLEVLTRLPYYLGKYKISEIINYGIAGALSTKLNLDELISIRTVYGHLEDIEFQSFTLDSKSKLDCITANERVLRNDHAEKLSYFAPIVDRELWAIAKIGKEYKIPVKSYKLISDIAGNETNCLKIKDQAIVFSQKLFQHYIDNHQLNQDDKNKVKLNLPFHASFTQRKRIEKLLEKIPASDKEDYIKTLSPKVKASDVILDLENKINPLKEHILQYIEDCKRPFHNIGAKLDFDPKLEKKMITLKMDINSEENLINLKRVLETYEYQKIENLWNGNINV